jgi:hypothetical protein
MQLLSTLAAVSATIATVQAGSAYIYNHCDTDIYVKAIDMERRGGDADTIKAGSTWSETYHTPSSGGVSLKIGTTPACDKITQFEYTLTGGNWNQIWYDGSDINCIADGCPFADKNLMVGASIDSCPKRYCAAADPKCTGFYNKPDDDLATLSCNPDADVYIHICLDDDKMPGGANYGQAGPPTPASSSKASSSTTPPPKAYTMEAPGPQTFKKVAHKTARSIAERSPEALAAHAHARRHLHGRV